MIKRVRWLGLVGLSVSVFAGCDVLLDILVSRTVTISLVNDSSFDVAVSMFTSDSQDIPAFLITTVGEQSTFTVPAGQTVTFFQDCDEAQAILIDDADLLVLIGLGPETSSDVLRDNSDFSCGDVVTFTFTHSAAILDFDVTTSVSGF